MKEMVSSLSLLISLALAGASQYAVAEEISFSERFTKSASQTKVTVQAADDDVLVIDAGKYQLNGKAITIAARRIRLSGVAIIQSFDPTSAPPPKSGVAKIGDTGTNGENYNCGGNGCGGGIGKTGSIGDGGDPGLGAETISLDALQLEGSGQLFLLAVGQRGGQGQQGGQGGPGGQGGRGTDRSCGGLVGLDTRAAPGNGGIGGTGGTGGQGGQGGQGGPGGKVYINDKLFGEIALGRLVISTSGGEGGQGGPKGTAGSGGLGNDGGAGASCGSGGQASGNGPSGSEGEEGLPGPMGGPGAVFYTTFVGEEPAPLPPSAREESQSIAFSSPPGREDECNAIKFEKEICVQNKIVGHFATPNAVSGVSKYNFHLTPAPSKENCVVLSGELTRMRTPVIDFEIKEFDIGPIKGKATFPTLIDKCPQLDAKFVADVISLEDK